MLGFTHALVRFGTVTHPVKRALRDTIVPAAAQVGPIHRRAVRRWTQVNVGYPASSLTWPDRGHGRPRPGQRAPDIEVRTQDGTSRLFTVLRRGRHVMVVTGADPDSVLASPALEPYRDLFEAVARGSGDARAFRGSRAGSVFLVRPDGYIAARGRPDRLETVLGYLRELSGETEISRPGRPTASGQPDPGAWCRPVMPDKAGTWSFPRHWLWVRHTLLPCGRLAGRRSGWAARRSWRSSVLAPRPFGGGEGAVVWVEGEPGIGKSSLVAEALAAASEPGWDIGWGMADQLTERLPLRVMLDCLQVRPGSPDPRRAQAADLLRGRRLGLFADGDASVIGVEVLITLVDELCAAAPAVIVVDDLQWADEASLVVWHQLAASIGQLRLLLIGTCRPTPLRPEVQQVRAAVVRRGGAVVTLGPLPETDVAALVTAMVGAPPGDALRRLTAQAVGNPLYVRELVDALVREQALSIRPIAEVALAGGAAAGLAGRGAD